MKASFCNKLFLCAAAVVIGILGHSMAHAQSGGVPLWTNRYNGSANGDDLARAMVVDSSGNVFVTGSSAGSGSGLDYATIKYSGAGAPLWTNFYNGPGNSDDVAKAIAVDGSGNVFVTGYSAGIGSSNDYATVCYSSGGVALWTNRYNGPGDGDDKAAAVAVDRTGKVFVTGYSTITNGYWTTDYTTLAYSSAGVPLWTNRYNGTENATDQARAMAVDAGGNVLVTGDNGYTDYATIKYSGAGVALWTNRYNGGYSHANAVAVDRSGNVFVTGGAPFARFATIKYSGAGVPLWTNVDGGAGSAVAMAVDSSGNVFVTGDSHGHLGDSMYETWKYSGTGPASWQRYYYSWGSDYPTAMAVDAGGNVFVTGHATGFDASDYRTVAYSGTGAQLWVNAYNGPANTNDVATAIAVDAIGNVYVTGYSTRIGSGYDYATIKYSFIPPSLTIACTTTNTVAVSWPSPSTGFTLQQDTNGIATGNWSSVLDTPSDDGTTKTVIVAPPMESRFYRLFHP